MASRASRWKWVIAEQGHSAGADASFAAGSDASLERADRRILHALSAGQGEWDPSAPTPETKFSRNQLHRLIEEGRVRINGEPIKANGRLRAGDHVEIEFPAPKPLELRPEDRPIDILYQDKHILVLNKPPGLTVHPSPTQEEGTLVHALLFHVKDLSGIGGALRPGIVHRLDKDTGGALVITKSDIAHQKLVETFSKHEIERVYWALCYGALERDQTLESLIGRNPADRKKMSMQVKSGRNAVTHFKTLETYGDAGGSAGKTSGGGKSFASLVEARLETGRTHQVRVHLTGLGHSLLGDPLYGVPSSGAFKWRALPEEVGEQVLKLEGQALHARVLGFEHPVTGEKLRFEAEPSESFRRLLEVLRRYRRS